MLSSMTRWLVTLAGSVADLDRLVKLPDGEDWQIIRHEKRGVVLCGERFEQLNDDSSLRRVAGALVEHLNRAAQYHLTDFQGVTLRATVEQGQGGDHLALLAHDAVHVHLAGKATVPAHVRLDAAITGAPAQSDTPRPGADCMRLVALLEAHPDLANALRYLEEEADLRGYYKVGEAILRALGRPKKWDTFNKLGWASDDEVWRFTGSTQTRRHHAVPGPDTPMSDSEARTFVRDLLDKLIKHLDSMTR